MLRSWSYRCWQFAFTLFGIALIGSGIYFYQNWTDIFTRMRAESLRPQSASFASWKSSPLPLTLDVYLFNWTNPEQFYVGSNVKPHFEELGPYKFRENKTKVDITWHPHNDSVTYRKRSVYHFDAEASTGRLNDLVTSVNAVLYGIAQNSRNSSKRIFNTNFNEHITTVKSDKLSITKTAGEWLFTGYKDALLKYGHPFLSKNVQADSFAWFYNRNGSSSFEGVFNVYTGRKDFSKLGQVHTWNGKRNTGAFDGACGNVTGAAGEFFPSNLKRGDTISLFAANMCRAIPLDYMEVISVHGVIAYKFAAGARAVDNGTMYPETKCNCVAEKCEPVGVINISPCKYNSPMYMSYPHFLKADPSYLNAIDGLAPNESRHEFFMALEPNAGLPMQVGGGFQANYLMEPIAGFSQFENIPRTFIPIMWCEQRVLVTQEIAGRLSVIPRMLLAGKLIAIILVLLGTICVIWYPLKIAKELVLRRKFKLVQTSAATTDLVKYQIGEIQKKPETSTPATQSLLATT